jgi:Pyruvate/2-oxoacid:ferredoxin oxidoreductase gamma subunit
VVSLGSVEAAIRARFADRLAQSNIAAAREAYEFVAARQQEVARA